MNRSIRMVSVLNAVLGLLSICVIPTLADDICPPPWRGELMTVQVEWDFHTFVQGQPPDFFNAVLPDTVELYDLEPVAYVDGLVWQPDPSNPTDGVLYASDVAGCLVCYMTNVLEPLKKAVIGMLGGGQSECEVSAIEGPPNYPMEAFRYDVIPCGEGQMVEHWQLEPGPPYEVLYIVVPPWSWLDRVVIDTIALVPVSAVGDPMAVKSATWGKIKSMFR